MILPSVTEDPGIKLPGIYAILSRSGKAVSLDALTPEEAYALLERDEPLTVYTADMVVMFRGGAGPFAQECDLLQKGGYISAIDTFTGKVARKEPTPEMGERLLRLLISEELDSYDGVEEFFSDFPVRFVP